MKALMREMGKDALWLAGLAAVTAIVVPVIAGLSWLIREYPGPAMWTLLAWCLWCVRKTRRYVEEANREA